MERVREKGGEITGRVAMVEINLLAFTEVRSTKKAKAKPQILPFSKMAKYLLPMATINLPCFLVSPTMENQFP